MGTTTKNNTQDTIEAWDLYCGGRYDHLVDRFQTHEIPDVKNLVGLARLELQPGKPASRIGKGIFHQLHQGMSAYHASDYSACSRYLGDWLLKKEYFSESILIRFCHAALQSNSYGAIQEIARKFLNRKNYRPILAGPVFISLYESGQHKKALQFFDKFREILDSPEILHKVALADIESGRYKEAESILLPLYKGITGREYSDRYDETRKKYTQSSDFKKLSKIKNRNYQEDLEYAFHLLFQEKYPEALEIFSYLKPKSLHGSN